MPSAQHQPIPPEPATAPVRPAWIPANITHEWDPDPYAYQTEEDLMPAGGLHGKLLGYLMEVPRAILERQGLMSLMDVFVIYADERGTPRRVAPDLMFTGLRDPLPDPYHLAVEPPPLAVIEVTSKKSRIQDMENKTRLYLDRPRIPAFLVIDATTPSGTPRDTIRLRLWRLIDGVRREVAVDPERGAPLPELGLRVQAHGKQLKLVDLKTGRVLTDGGDWEAAVQAQARRADAAARRADEQARQAEAQRQRADEQARQAEAQRQRAEEHARRAEEQAQQAAEDQRRAHAAEAEIARLRALLGDQAQR